MCMMKSHREKIAAILSDMRRSSIAVKISASLTFNFKVKHVSGFEVFFHCTVMGKLIRIIFGLYCREGTFSQIVSLWWTFCVITFTLCTLVYKSPHGSAPRYLAELCNPVASDSYRRNLRSAGKNELIVPRHKLSTYGPRSFELRAQLLGIHFHNILGTTNFLMNSF